MSDGRYHDYFIYYAVHKMNGCSKEEAMERADKECGGNTVAYSLMSRADQVSKLAKEVCATKQAKKKRAKRVELTALVEKLYSADFCPKHREWIHKTAKDATRPSYDMAWLYESLQKSIIKTGCDQCAIKKRF